jgi:hypothetical protein
MLQAQTHQTAKKFKLHAKIHAWSPHENPMPTRSFLLSRQILRIDRQSEEAEPAIAEYEKPDVLELDYRIGLSPTFDTGKRF